MKIAYIGDFINHGTSLPTFGTSLVILLSRMKEMTSMDVYCPKPNKIIEECKIPNKTKIISFYEYDNPISIIRLLKVKRNNYDLIIFNMLPTGFGKSSLSNSLALMIPVILTKLWKSDKIKVIYHNSILTNDFKALGYNSIYDKIRSYFLRKYEKMLFKHIPTYVLLNLYKEKIEKVVGQNKVHVLNSSYIEAIPSIYLNDLMEKEFLRITKYKIPMILLHGYWGPQKDIDLALTSLSKLQNRGIKFRLVISGGVNDHFPNYRSTFKKLLDLYSNIIDEYLGYVKERELVDIFLKTDLILLPYKTPGGHSGVLEQAMFFEVPVIAFDFPEYREQAAGNDTVSIIKQEEFVKVLMRRLNSINKNDTVNIEVKIREVSNNVKSILSL